MDETLDNQHDAELIARLAAGEHLGERHDAELARIAASPVLATALRVAIAAYEESEALAQAIARERAPRVVPFVPRQRRVLPWVALAATVAGVALLATSMQHGQEPAQQPAVAQQPGHDDTIFGQTFEGAIADSGEAGDDIFDGEFDS